VKFRLFKIKGLSLHLLLILGLRFACYEAMELVDMSPNDPYILNYASFKGHGLDDKMGDFTESIPPNIVKNKPYAFDEDCLSVTIGFCKCCFLYPFGRC